MTKQITLRSLLFLLFIIFTLLNLSQKSYSQANITSTVPNLLIACGNNDTFTVTVYNTSTTDTFKNAKLYVSMPTGMRYKAGSVSGSGVSQFNIDTLNKPKFNLPQILPSSNLQITFLASAGCGVNTSGLLTNTYTLRYNATQVYSSSSSSYSAYSASLSINSITNQTGNLNLCYDTLKRNITITNSGNGHITSFLFTITKQSNVIIHNINKGSVTTSGNTYYVSVGANDFKTIGDNDSLFELNESIVIEETVVAGGVNNLGETYSLTWGCNSQNCQTVNSSATMTVNLSLVPNLSFSPSTSLNTCYGGSNASNMQLRIINTGSAVAENIDIDIYQTINGNYAYRSTYYTRIDQNSFTNTQNGQTSSVSPTSYIATNNHTCFNSTQAIGSVTLRLPKIDVGDTAILRWNVYSCCQGPNSSSNQEAFGWSFSAQYGTPCRTNTFSQNPTTGYTRRLQRLSFNEAITPSIALANQDTTTVGFSFHYFDLFPGTSNRKIRFTISNSNCLNIDSNSFVYQNFAGNKTWPIGSQYVDISGNIVLEYNLRNIPSGFSMVDSRLLFDVSDNCSGCSNNGGFKTISISVDYIPDPSCNCEMTMNSTSMNVPISCPIVCDFQGGIKNEPFNVYRTSYGQPDNDNNGLPDASGSLDFSKVKTDRAMFGDTIITELVGILSGKHNWKYGYGIIKFGYNYFTDAGTTLRIYDSSRARYYTVNNMPFTNPANGEFKYCFSLDSIKTYGGNVPPNFKYKSGDSILLYPKFKVTTNIGGATRWVTVDGENYMSYSPTVTADTAKHFCGHADLIGNINIVGYYFTIYGPNTLYPEACQEFTVYQSYYLSIGPCCNNYAGGNMFPYEYRSWSIPVKALYTIPPGFEFVSARINYRRTAGDHVTHYTNVPTFAPVDSHSNPLIFDIRQFFTNNTFYPSDDGYHGTVYVTLRPECGYDLYPQNHIFYQFEHRGTTGYMDTSIYSPSSSNPFYNNGPTLSIQGLNTYQAIDSTAQWNFTVTNTSSASIAPNTWLNISQLSGKINTLYIVNNTDNDTIYENNGYFNLGTIGKSVTKSYNYVAIHNACSDDSISLKTGWHCDTNYSNIETSCYEDSLTFYLNPQPANISMQVYSPDDTTNLCDTIDYEITLNGSQSGTLYDVLLQLKILQGISVVPNSCELLYPLSSSYRSINNPVYIGNAIYEWDISSIDSIIGNHGLSGTSDTARNKLRLKFRLNTNCQVISGNVFEIIARAKHSCGQDISPVTSPSKPILIRGAKQSYISTINILTDTLEICSGSEKIKLRFTNLGPDSTSNADYIQLILPLGYSYNQNSTQNIIYADSIKEPNIFNYNGYTQLSWELPSGIKNSKYIEYEFSVSQDSVINCGKQAFTFQSVVLDSLICVATNSLCEFKVQTGVKTDSMLIYKPNPQFVSFSATSVVDTPNKEKIRLEIRIINDGKPIISGDTTFVQVFNDKDKNSTLSANDTFLGYLFSTSALGPNDTITFIDTFSIPSGYNCPLIAALIQDTNSLSNCQCDHQEILLNDIPISYNLPDTSFCSGDTISIGVDSISGYQYSWSPSMGILDQDNKLTRITLTNTGSEPDTVTYTLTTSRGSSACATTEEFKVIVYPQPSVNFSKDKNLSCYKFNIFNFWNHSNIDTAFHSNIWKIDNHFISNLDSFIFSFTDTGTHTIQLISTTNFGCSDSNSKTIYINPSPEVNFSINDTSQCSNGNNFSFSNFSIIKSGSMTYLWRLGNNDTSTLTSFSKTFDSFGLFNITLIATSDLNCKDSVTKAIFISKSPYDIDEKGKYVNSLDSAIVAYYPLDYNTNDFSGNNYHLSNSGATSRQGIINNSYELDGVNDYMGYVPISDSAFAPMTKDWTITAWFKVPPGSANNSPKGNIISWYRCGADPNCGANDGAFYTLYYKNDLLYFQARNNDLSMGKAIVSTHNTLETGRWYFAVGKIDQTNDSLHLFIDGCLDSSVYYDFNLLSPGGTVIPFSLGRGYITGWGNPASYYDGFIDEVRVYERSLSIEEIQSLFRMGRGTQVFCDDTIVCFSDSTVIKVAYPQKDIKYELLNLKTNTVVGNSQYGSCDTLYFYTPSMTDTTTFRIKATDTNNLCDIFLDTSFTIYSIPKPYADILISDTSQCLRGNSFSFTNLSTISGGTMTYSWEFGDGDTSSNQHENHIYDTNSTFRVSLIATSDLGCIDSIEKYILVNPHPDIDFSINDSDQCKNGNSFIITNQSTIISGSTNYLYDFGDGTSSILNSPTKTYNSEGNYSIKLVGESDFGCKDSLSKNVYVRPNPQVDFSINDTSQCFNGNQFIFTNNTTISGGSYNFSWTTDDTTFINTSPITYSYYDVDSYDVKLVALSDYNCTDSVIKKVYVRPEPVANFNINDSNQCLSGNLFIFEDTSDIEYGSLSYFWDYEIGDTSGTDSFGMQFSSVDTFIIKLLVTSNFGCKDSITKQVVNRIKPAIISQSTSDTLCENLNECLFVTPSGTPPFTYQWKKDGTNISGATDSSFCLSDISPTDSGLYSCVISNDCGNITSDIIKLTVFELPNFSNSTINNITTSESEVCEDDPFQLGFLISGTEPIYYQWYKDGSAISGANDTIFTIANSQTSDSGYYYCIATNMCGSDTSNQVHVIVHPRPHADFSINNPEQCLNQNLFQFYDSTTMTSNDSLIYWWDFGDNQFDSVQNTNHRFTTYDSFTVKFKVTSEYGCADSVQKLAIVRPSPVSNFSIDDSGQCLTNNLFAFTNSTSVAYGSNSYKWYFGDNDSSIASNPSHSYGIEDTYTVQLIANSDFGCKDTSQKLLVVYPMPNAQFSINDSNQCFNENNFAFTDQSGISSGFLNYNWNFGDFTTSTNQNPNHTYTLDDTFSVKLVLNSDNGCMDSTSKTVYIFPITSFKFHHK
jgi:PKD repeat protein